MTTKRRILLALLVLLLAAVACKLGSEVPTVVDKYEEPEGTYWLAIEICPETAPCWHFVKEVSKEEWDSYKIGDEYTSSLEK